MMNLMKGDVMSDCGVVFWVNTTTGMRFTSPDVEPFERVFSMMEQDDDYVVDMIVRFSTHAEALEAIRIYESGGRLLAVDADGLTPTMQDRHKSEKQEHGWSYWEILALGFDCTLAVEFADSIRDVVPAEIADAIRKPAEDDGDRNVYRKAREAYLWVADHVDTVADVSTPDGRFPMFRVMGEAIQAFGDYELHSYPGVGIYGGDLPDTHSPQVSDKAAEKWRNDCRKYGKLLQTGHHADMREALVWLADWYHSLWD